MPIYSEYHHFDLMSTCIHESGHVVSGLINYIKIEDVTVECQNNAGLTNYCSINLSENTNKFHLERAQAEILMLYAGLIAEKNNYINIFGKILLPKDLNSGAEIDNALAAELIIKYDLAPPGEKRAYFKKKAIKKSNAQIKEHWDDVLLIARELFIKKKLSYIELQELLTKKSKAKVFWKKQFKKINFIFNSKKSLDEEQLKSIFLYLTN